jgi:shikimate dehydrogenase
MIINKDTKLCMSLAGRPGNFGTRFHNYLYQELGLNFVYKAFTTQDLRGAITGIRALGIRGCAVSMPFKEKCIEYLNELDDELDASARGIMSVNTIVNDDGHLKAYNTDYSAVFQLLKSHEISTQMDFAVLGSGGMAKAVVCALRDSGFEQGVVVARNPQAGPALAAQYGYAWKDSLEGLRAGLIVNVTPIGMAGGAESQELAFPPEAVSAARVVFDVVATPVETPLIPLAKSLGKQFISGAEVNALQAAEQFILYTGVRPSQELLEKAAAFARSSSDREIQ